MNELTGLSLARMAEAIRAGDFSSEELVRAHLERIGQVNPRINAVVELAAEEALAAAREADAALTRGPEAGPLHGVPVSVKGAWDCRGWVNSGGTLGRRHFRAAGDATVIARLRRAGAIPLATTNLPEYSLAFESDNLIYGRTSNPYDLDRSPGGSGGGGAAAIAAGCSPFEVGGDLGGSIRLPCHYCGIAGLKTTLGRVPLTGYFPPCFGPASLFATAGPMARFAGDLTLTLPILSGPDLADPGVADAVLGDPRRIEVKSLRVAFHLDNGIAPPCGETAATVRSAAQALAGTGAPVEEARPEMIDQTMDIFLGIMGADGGDSVAGLNRMAGTAQNSPLFEGSLNIFGRHRSGVDGLMERLVRRDLFRTKMAGFFQRYDVLLCPVNAHPAPPHGRYVEDLPNCSYTFTHNLSGCPAAVVRCGTSGEGLPIGVQVVAAPWREHVALAAAAVLESVLGGWQPPRL